MPNQVAQRIGPASRAIVYLEATRGSDAGITAGLVVPLRDKSGFQIVRPESEAPYFNGGMQGYNSAPGLITAAGPLPCGLEFLTAPIWPRMIYGSGGYSRVGLVTGSLHHFAPQAAPTPITSTTAQIQNEYLEATAQYERARYCQVSSLALSYASQGVAPLDVNLVASGDASFIDLAGTKAENGYNGISVYNGYARMATASLVPTWYPLAGVQDFKANLDCGTTAEPVGFNSGVAGSVNLGVPMLKGNLGLMMATDGAAWENNFNFVNAAINRTPMSYDCAWTDAPVDGGQTGTNFPTSFARLRIATLRLGRKSETPAGKAGRQTNQDWMHILDSVLSKIPAEAFGTVVGPYAITAGTNDIATFKIEGGANIPITLTPGAARTALQICTDLNANGTFSAAAVADVFMGRVRVTSKQVTLSGVLSSVQFVTGILHGCETTLGFNNTVITGFNSPYVWTFWNAQNTNY